jgi:hypothetical protein
MSKVLTSWNRCNEKDGAAGAAVGGGPVSGANQRNEVQVRPKPSAAGPDARCFSP